MCRETNGDNEAGCGLFMILSKDFREQTGRIAGNGATEKSRHHSQLGLPLCPFYLRDLGSRLSPSVDSLQPVEAAESLSRDDFCASGSFYLSGSGLPCAFGVSNHQSIINQLAIRKLSHQITIVN